MLTKNRCTGGHLFRIILLRVSALLFCVSLRLRLQSSPFCVRASLQDRRLSLDLGNLALLVLAEFLGALRRLRLQLRLLALRASVSIW